MWPIMLTPAQSDAVLREVQAWLDDVRAGSAESRFRTTVLLSKLRRSVQIEFEEQELLRAVLLQRAIYVERDQHFETAVFKLFGFWPREPRWYVGTIRPRR